MTTPLPSQKPPAVSVRPQQLLVVRWVAIVQTHTTDDRVRPPTRVHRGALRDRPLARLAAAAYTCDTRLQDAVGGIADANATTGDSWKTSRGMQVDTTSNTERLNVLP